MRINPKTTVSLTTFFLAVTLAHAADPREIYTQLRTSVLQLELRNAKDQPSGAYTAIVVAPRQVAVACDVLSSSAKTVVITGARTLSASVRARDLQRNLCLLDVTDLDAPAAKLAAVEATPAVGARVYAISNALGLGVGISEGVVAGIREFGDRRYIQFSAPISPGSEGGALVNDAGQLIGVIDYRHRDGQNVNFAAPAQWLAEIEGRKVTVDDKQNFRERAVELARERKLPELMKLARDWTAATPNDIEAWRYFAWAAEAQSDLDTEEKAYREMLRINPVMVSAGVGMSQVMFKRKQYKEALDLARGLLTLRQEDADVWVAIGQAELMLNNLDSADEAYRRAMSLFPWANGAGAGLVEVAERRGNSAGVTLAWQRLAHLFPDAIPVQIQLVRAYIREQRPAKGLPLVERLLERDPKNAELWYWKGAVMGALGRPTDAIAGYRAALEKSPTDAAYIWGALGDTYFNLSLFPESIQAYREAVRLSKDNVRWRFWLAVALKDGGHIDEAIALDQKLMAEHPDDPAPARQLANALAQAGRFKEAIPAYEKSLTLASRQPRTWHGLMGAYHAEGRIEDMRRGYDKLRDLDTKEADAAYRALILPNEEPQ
jgi:tetratricopeptide (TPR) repeat protein